MNVNLLYPPEKIGQRELLGCYGSGPTSYNQTTGDVLVLPPGLYIDFPCGEAMTVDRTYYVRFFPSATGGLRPTWTADWYVTATAAKVANGVNLSAESIQFGLIGGEF